MYDQHDAQLKEPRSCNASRRGLCDRGHHNAAVVAQGVRPLGAIPDAPNVEVLPGRLHRDTVLAEDPPDSDYFLAVRRVSPVDGLSLVAPEAGLRFLTAQLVVPQYARS